MKIAIVFDSQTGNTAQVAQAIRTACEGHDIVAFGPPPQNVDQAELVFAGSWTDKGSLTPAMQEFLHSLYGKRVALFGTAGFGGSQAYFDAILQRTQALLPAGNIVLGGWMCQGRMPAAVRVRYEAMAAQNPDDPKPASFLANFDHALSHPDQTDLAAASAFAAEMAAKAKG